MTEKISKYDVLSVDLLYPQSEKEYDALQKRLDKLIDIVGCDEDHELASFMNLIGGLIEEYENEHLPPWRIVDNCEVG